MTEELRSRSVRQALGIMLQGHDFARQLGHNEWDFAVDVAELRAAGVSPNSLRWLLARGLVEQAVEVNPEPGQRRAFRPEQHWVLSGGTCFILTTSGLILARRQAEDTQMCPGGTSLGTVAPVGAHPSWDSLRRTLSFRTNVIKQFKVPAPNQELILSVFEEEAWPYRIDDPLPLVSDIEPKRRLHDTINALNRHQRVGVLRFSGDGQGTGVCWAVAAPELTGPVTSDTRLPPEQLYSTHDKTVDYENVIKDMLVRRSICEIQGRE